MNAIAAYLLGSGTKKLWKDLDNLQQAAIAEAVHVTGGLYQGKQFQAKYGDVPEWNTRANSYSYHQPAAKLDLFFYPQSNYSSTRFMQRLTTRLDCLYDQEHAGHHSHQCAGRQ